MLCATSHEDFWEATELSVPERVYSLRSACMADRESSSLSSLSFSFWLELEAACFLLVVVRRREEDGSLVIKGDIEVDDCTGMGMVRL